MTVYLVGAGPGDPGLLTVRAAQLLARADVVVHDRLADERILRLAPSRATLIDVGKSPGAPVAQDHINRLLIDHGRQGATVVRLKGGDPFVFGRGGEEAQALAGAGVAFEVVPGITSAVAVPAYAGIPVTQRGMSTSLTIVTGHRRSDLDRDTDWEALARVGGTLVVLMGVAHRGEIATRLMAGGLAPDTPVAVVSWGTRSGQTTQRATLSRLGATRAEPPATIVIGPVAALDLAWFARRPLLGRRVVVTRAAAQAAELVARLDELGAETVEVPAIEVVEPADGGAALRAAAVELAAGAYDWVVFTSPRGVERFVPLLRDGRAFGTTRIACIGPGTAAALADRNLVADLVPGEFVAEALLAALPDGPGRVLIPRAAVARDVLPVGLAARGWEVSVVEAYRTVPVAASADVLGRVAGADAITFTSSSTVTNYLAVAGAEALPPIVACIGPVTAATARAAGLEVDVVAGEHTVAGLVAALVDALAGRPRHDDDGR